MGRGITSRLFIHVVIPELVYGNVLAERSIGRDDEPDYEDSCREIARSKARIHVREGMPSRAVHDRRAASLAVGDTVHGGSFAHEDVVVAASGVQGHFDETVSGMVAAILWGLIKQAQESFMASRGDEYMYRKPVPIPSKDLSSQEVSDGAFLA